MTDVDVRRRRVGQAIQKLGHAFVGHDVPDELLDELAAALEGFTGRLDEGVARSRDMESWDKRNRPVMPDGARMNLYEDRPFSGHSSPWGVDLHVHRRGDEIEGTVTLGSAHEGAPGRSHGGIVAGLFDDVFGFVLDVIQQQAFTGELTIRYVAPTPLHRPLLCRGRLRERVGRKIWIEGEMIDPAQDDALIIRAEGLFIAVDPDVVRTARLPLPDEQ